MFYLSLILQHSQNWLVPSEPQKHEKHETDRILTQKYVKKYRRKCNLIFLKKITKHYKILIKNKSNKKGKNTIPN